jgi:uncharacterized membrane-anchored protein
MAGGASAMPVPRGQALPKGRSPLSSNGARTRGAVGAPRAVSGRVRAGRRTKLLVKRLQRGEIALIDHLDIDRVSAEELIAAGAAAVLNCRASSSGSYPNLGPQLLVEAGILLVDLPDDALFEAVSDGDELMIVCSHLSPAAGTAPVSGSAAAEHPDAVAPSLAAGAFDRDTLSLTQTRRITRPFAILRPQPLLAEVLRESLVVARGDVLDLDRVCSETEARRREVGEALERFARNTVEHMREERELLAGRIELPRFATEFRDRSTLVVARGVGHQRDLRALRPFIRDMRPVIVAVDGGAEALLEEGLSPDMIVGDMDSAGEPALRCGAELVLHSYADGHAPGRERLEGMDVPFSVVPAPGTSQDLALLIAAEKGARLIVSVGSQFNLVEFLDRNRRGMSSTFLTRLRIGEILVDAKGVSRLYHPRPALTPLLVVIAAGLVALLAVVWMTPALRDVVSLLWLKLQLLLGSSG